MFPNLHPFSQLTAAEIKLSSQIIRQLHPANTVIIFKTITLQEPDKEVALEYLQAESEHRPDRPVIDRRSFVAYYRKDHDYLHESVINLATGQVVYNEELDKVFHGPADLDEVGEIEALVHTDLLVLAELQKYNLDKSLLVCEPWVYGSDGINDERRQYQCLLFMRHPDHASDPESNHYALPLPFSPVVDVIHRRVTRIDYLPTGADNMTPDTKGYKVPPPNEYAPKYQNMRTDLKPLNVIQPEGASFTITEDFECSQVVSWQKWRLRLGFNAREGMVLYDVRYDGRPLFYRVSLSDMNIPYADPRHPFHKKAAFDLGDAGAGYTANNLKLGCDCLGSIFYVSSILSSPSGGIVEKPNCVCIHEQDSGIGWKHTNYRTDTAVVTRARELVLQSILTVANYEYILAFIFTQAGDISYEVRATGILSTQPIDKGVDVNWGTIVHPGVLAAQHQHIFSLRLDPMLDGPRNSLTYEEAHAMDPCSPLNPHGTGYYTRETTVQTSGGYDLDEQKNRVFKIKNTSSLNQVNNKAAGYKIMVHDFQKMLASKESYHHRRAEFADHNIYVTKYRPNELYAAGQYTNQSRGGAGVRTWAGRQDAVVDEDIVVWVQFGINHVPRIEDFPVMPVEILKVHLRPVNFFTKNPALDVPPSTQAFNKSCQIRAAATCTNGTAAA
ncbi:copper amine oxidase [Pochonia chlamydosporia 170]|uniref:Amine oxidase n=1 Tax=Pochonia chlamydosporia 170 TaxID=1380566 RepID=A0A179F0Y3_METCM|nr:copper amine oxidase [Pochonia chlamydosporia 170]OAQ59106.1 copper amine oxidase [Pochonia chlamydosporia 170]